MSTITADETITVETILNLIEQLPSHERTRLHQMLTGQAADPAQAKPPRDKRVPAKPMKDRTRERQWVQEHKHEYAGQWVALDGHRLVAASCVQQEVWDAVDPTSPDRPLVLRISSPDDLPYIGI
ncbi:MAG TPA: hypothetical protein VFZ34_33505 [Blastocatellia bacterium]|nr:hypothetical protein [Blastocatellia bacterium]